MLVAVILTVFSVGVYFYWPGPVWFLIGTVVAFVRARHSPIASQKAGTSFP